jgi:hypothetical protein
MRTGLMIAALILSGITAMAQTAPRSDTGAADKAILYYISPLRMFVVHPQESQMPQIADAYESSSSAALSDLQGLLRDTSKFQMPPHGNLMWGYAPEIKIVFLAKGAEIAAFRFNNADALLGWTRRDDVQPMNDGAKAARRRALP